PPILSNTLIIPWVLKFAYGSEDLIWYMMITIGIGEILAIGVLGQLLISVLAKYRKMIFG
ncbi:MAG: QueT transporter family protein, partial [Lachnospiraceae bacterium]|nr:QueT transporter family protein [Lachnospiraceae bacterium]